MEKLNQKLWSILKEYTMQVAELMDCSEWHWIGTDDDGVRPASICDFDSTIFLTLEDMQVIIDRLDEWVKRYGSKDAVANEVREWVYWWLDDTRRFDPNPLIEIYENRLNRYQRTIPRINLQSWLAGCPRECDVENSIDDELRLLVCQRDTVKELIEKYRDARTLWNIFDNLGDEIKAKKAIKEKRDKELLEEMKKSDLYKKFEDAIKEHSEQVDKF